MQVFDFIPSTANVRELREFCKRHNVPNYGAAVKQGKAALVKHVERFQHNLALSMEMEAECEEVLAPEPAPAHQEAPQLPAVELTTLEKGIAMAIDTSVFTYELGNKCGKFYFAHLHEPTKMVLSLVLVLLAAMASYLLLGARWLRAAWAEYQPVVAAFVRRRVKPAAATAWHWCWARVGDVFYPAVEWGFDVAEKALRAWLDTEDKGLAYSYLGLVGTTLIILH